MTRMNPAVAAAAAALVVLSMIATPAAALPLVGGGDQVDPASVDYSVDSGDVVPSFVVHTDSPDSLEEWANKSPDRAVVESFDSRNISVVAAPRVAALELSALERVSALRSAGLDALTGEALETESWTDGVRPNWELSLDRPDSLDAGEFETPEIGFMASNDPNLPTEGLAFNDEVNDSDLSEARSAVGADSLSATGSGLTVAVLDTGANTANGRLFGDGTDGSNIRIDNASQNMITGASVDTSTANYSAISDGNGHGTWVASAIAANASGTTFDGVARDSSLLVLKALADDGSGSTADIAEAIRYAADQDADVISMSLGSPVYSEELADAVGYAEDNGSVVVLASGNSRIKRGANVASPADAEGALTVGATTAEAASEARSAYFSQVGPDPSTLDLSEGASEGAEVDVAAPGMKVTAKVSNQAGSLSNDTLSGTSMATPLVSASIAAAQETNSSLSGYGPAEVDQAVIDTARTAPNAAAVEVGAGMVAADQLASGATPDSDQADAMDDAAAQRDEFYRALSDASGGTLAEFLAVLS